MFKKYLSLFTFTGFVLLLAWVPASSFAAPIAASAAFDSFMWTTTGGASQTVGFTTSGTPVLSPATPLIDTDGGLPRVTQTGQLRNPSGGAVAVSATGRISGAEVGKAFGRFAAKVSGPLVVGVALYDLGKELNYTLTRNGVAIDVTKTTTTTTQNYACNGIVGSSRQAACDAFCRSPSMYPQYWTGEAKVQDGNGNLSAMGEYGYCKRTNGTWDGWYAITASGAPIVTGTTSASTLQALQDEIAAKSGWPSTSNIARVLADPLAAGETKIVPGALTVTGPASTPGVVTTTVNTTNNTTKTETTTHNHTYQGNTITTNSVLTSVVVNNATGAEVSRETATKTGAPPAAEPAVTCGLPGTPVCAVKVDESGTHVDLAVSEYQVKADAVMTSKEAGLDRMKGTGDTAPLFSGWSALFSAPAFVVCSPIVLPDFKGAVMGSLNPCPVVDGMRQVMSYLWAAGGLFLCLGFVRQAVQGG